MSFVSRVVYVVNESKHHIYFDNFAALNTSHITSQLSGIEPLNGTNFLTWKEQIEICLGVLELDHAFCMDAPTPPTTTSSNELKANYEKWERSNRMSLMIMKSSITPTIRGAIPEKDSANKTFNAKEYLASVEEQFKGTSKTNASTLIMKMLTTKYNETNGIREHIMMMSDMAAKLKAWI